MQKKEMFLYKVGCYNCMTKIWKTIRVSEQFFVWLWKKHRGPDKTIEGTLRRLLGVKNE